MSGELQLRAKTPLDSHSFGGIMLAVTGAVGGAMVLNIFGFFALSFFIPHDQLPYLSPVTAIANAIFITLSILGIKLWGHVSEIEHLLRQAGISNPLSVLPRKTMVKNWFGLAPLSCNIPLGSFYPEDCYSHIKTMDLNHLFDYGNKDYVIRKHTDCVASSRLVIQGRKAYIERSVSQMPTAIWDQALRNTRVVHSIKPPLQQELQAQLKQQGWFRKRR